MKTLSCSILFFCLSTILVFGEGNGRAVHLRPEANAPVIGHLPADRILVAPAEPVELSEDEKAEGWKAISFLDNLKGYVREANVRKDLTISSGSTIFAEADEGSPALTRAESNDLIEVERVDRGWAAISFRKPVTGYIQERPDQALAGTDESRVEEPETFASEPEAVEIEDAPERQERSAVTRRSAIPSDGIQRTFEGWLAPTRSFFGRSQPYDHQITDYSGNRIAYLELSKLLITNPLDRFYGRQFEFYGKAEPLEGRRDFVIRVERMLLK